jgi:hypothetical protein
MTEKHEFLFQTSRWIGEGRITFSASSDRLHFYTSWLIEKKGDIFHCEQHVEMQGSDNVVTNFYVIKDLDEKKFNIHLDNELLGKVEGSGLIDKKTIAWEFKENPLLEGFEVYELQENGDYMVHAEYSSTEQFRTIIDGRIWKKS